MSARYQTLQLVLLCLLLHSCSEKNTPAPAIPSEIARSEITRAELSIDLFAARGFLGGNRFERYYLYKDILWRECGTANPQKARKPFASRQTLIDSKERRIETLTKSQLEQLKISVHQLLKQIKTSEEKKAPAGSFHSMSDPGLFEVQMELGDRKQRFVTSVDALSKKSSPRLFAARSLFAKLRGVGPKICNSKTFFGVAKEDIQSE